MVRRAGVAVLCLMAAAAGGDLRTGFELRGLSYRGPGVWKLPFTPIWVHEYSVLRVRYRASGLADSDSALLSLRPGSVGPVTPGATNRENPFAMGAPVAAIAQRDLVADGQTHTFEINLRGKLLTAQMDQLEWRLPAGARLEVEELAFRAPTEVVSCTGGPALPEGAKPLSARAPLSCEGAPATSLRGREAIVIEGGGRRGGALYLSLTAHLPVVTNFVAGQPVDRWRLRETSETSFVLARVRYADSTQFDEQFPLLVSERRFVLRNRQPELYALALDAKRPLACVELLDRSEHVQLILHAAGLAATPPPEPALEPLPPPKPAGNKPAGPVDMRGSPFYRIRGTGGKPAPPEEALAVQLEKSATADGLLLSLRVRNLSAEPLEFALAFPALELRPATDPTDVYYLFPRQGAVVSRAERSWEAVYTANFPLQLLDAFAPRANRGAAVIVKDASAQLKIFRLKKAGATVSAETEYPVRLGAGETFHAPNVSLVFHGGDWREGFQAYQRWVRSWYKPAGPRPAWLREAWWCRRDYPVGGSDLLFDVRRNRYTFEELIREGRAFGGIDFIDISGWGLSETSGRVGDYPIELGGAEDLRANIAQAMKAGIPTGLYFEGYLVDKNSRIGREKLAAWQLIGADGKGAWWPGGSPEFFVCPALKDWQEYFASRVAAVAREVGAHAVYIDQHGFGTRRCYSTSHGHPPGVGMIPYEIEMARAVRSKLDAAGMRQTAIYLEETPVDVAAPYYDAAFCYAIPHALPEHSPAKLNLWRFVFTDVRLWDMLSIGVQPRPLSLEDFRLSLWHGNGVWLKGRSETWYGEETLAFLRRAHGLLKRHAAAFNGQADPMVASPHPFVAVNRFRGGGQTVYTLFNVSYRTARFRFEGRTLALGPRQVLVLESGARE